MPILIIKCNNRGKWYSDLVGKEVPLLAVEENEYMSREPEGYINFISKEDGVITDGFKDL